MKKHFVLTNTLFLLIASFIFLIPAQAEVSADAQAFWTKFRAAVLTGDKDKVLSITQFPFKTRGDLDDDPIRSHNKKSFLKNYDKIFSEHSYDASMTVKKVIEKKEKIIAKDFLHENSIRIENLIFEKNKGQWYFTFAYVMEN